MGSHAYIVFCLEDQWVGLPVASVRQILRAVSITQIPDAPELIAGLINMAGEMIPVINIRKQFKLPEKEISLSDRILIVQALGYSMAFVVDDVAGVVEFSDAQIVPAAEIFPKLEDYVAATAPYLGKTVLIYDIKSLFPNQPIETITHQIENILKNS